jgi:hypothetical protein
MLNHHFWNEWASLQVTAPFQFEKVTFCADDGIRIEALQKAPFGNFGMGGLGRHVDSSSPCGHHAFAARQARVPHIPAE